MYESMCSTQITLHGPPGLCGYAQKTRWLLVLWGRVGWFSEVADENIALTIAMFGNINQLRL